MTTSKSTQATDRNPVTVIKLGGSLLSSLTPTFYRHLVALKSLGNSLVIVHGGGPAINKELASQNIATPVVNGLRVTSKEAIKVVQSTLIGLVNPSLVYQLNKVGIQAVGLNGFDGNLLECSFLDEEIYECVGEINHVKTDLLNSLIVNNFVPVLSCIGSTEDGQPLNINADTVAEKVALSLNAKELLLVTDTPGIKINDKTQQTASQKNVLDWIQSGDIYGGMIPKVQAALNCIEVGIPSVHIVGEALKGTKITQEVTVQ